MNSNKGLILFVKVAVVIGMATSVTAEELPEIQTTSIELEAKENQEDLVIAPGPDKGLDHDVSNGERGDLIIAPLPEDEELIIAPNPAENGDYDVYILDDNGKAEGCVSGETYNAGLQSIGLLGIVCALGCILLVGRRKKID